MIGGIAFIGHFFRSGQNCGRISSLLTFLETKVKSKIASSLKTTNYKKLKEHGQRGLAEDQPKNIGAHEEEIQIVTAQ